MTLPTEIKKKKEGYIKESYMHDFFATKLLSDRELKNYLILIIAGILMKPAEEIERDFTYLDIRLGFSKNDVNSVADLVVSFNMGYVSIEMNWTLGEVLLNKNMLYMCELLLRQAKRQEDYKKIKKYTKSISITNRHTAKRSSSREVR